MRRGPYQVKLVFELKKFGRKVLLPVLIAALQASSLAAGASDEKIAGTPVPCQLWVSETEKPKAVMLCIHGMGLHKGTFDSFGRRMAEIGIPTYAIDVRGFGDWPATWKVNKLDLDKSIGDVGKVLEHIKVKYPDVPVIVLGESMGGAIALRAAATYPNLVDGLVSSVPSGDRFHQGDTQLKVGFNAIFGGFDKPIDMSKMLLARSTKNPKLREVWGKDPLARFMVSPRELMQFQNFMNKNFEMASLIKNKPVLFFQSLNDKLVHPEGTLKLEQSLATANRQATYSKTCDHLIFEYAQFSDDDLNFLKAWIHNNVTPLGDAVASLPQTVASNKEENKPSVIHEDPETQVAVKPTDSAAPPASEKPAGASGPAQPVAEVNLSPSAVASTSFKGQGISYWIELHRDGKFYRCNNKMSFKSGDAIRFHVIPEGDGYAYIVMKQGSSGTRAVLFPDRSTGTDNYLRTGQDYPVPYVGWLQFDAKPGTEKLQLLFSKEKLDPEVNVNVAPNLIAYVSPEADRSGAKDLVPTRMELAWDDPTPVVINPDLSDGTQVASRPNRGANSLVKLIYKNPGGIMAVDIALAHQ